MLNAFYDCLRRLNAEVNEQQVAVLFRLMLDVAPGFREKEMLRLELEDSRAIIVTLRLAIEEVLCGNHSSNQRLTILETAMNETRRRSETNGKGM